jgi:hypothetical protein
MICYMHSRSELINFVFRRSVRRLLVTPNVVPSSPNLATLMMKAIRSFETSVLPRATRRNIPEDDILHSHRCEKLKSYITLIFVLKLLSNGFLDFSIVPNFKY